jgi:DNA gyrase subunit A
MAKKKLSNRDVMPEVVAEIRPQLITDTIETNFMPYAMSVIVSRAIPDIDGFKPSHRKILYTMYKMGLLTGSRVKSATVVGETMKRHPHGDQAIYATLVRLSRGNESLLHPFVDSKGNFGKHYSTDTEFAAPRYTECKLEKFAAEVFAGIDKNAVDLVDNYDNTLKEPTLLPTTYPNILVSPNLGVAVGMACSICSFNLGEVCDGTIQLLKNPNTDIDRLLDIIRGPDFPCGGSLIYNREKMHEIYETGRGSVSVRARYSYDKTANCIDVHEIPYTTTVEAIIKKIKTYTTEGKLKEIVDVRDEIDINGFKLTIDLRRGTDPEKLMTKLFKMTPLEDSFECNFNILVHGTPRQLGVKDILLEWIDFRMNCLRRELTFELGKKKEKLHLLLGLGKILLDIDKAIKIVRSTEKEEMVVRNLMDGFGIDEIQAEYIADIKLRYLNREYIINRVNEIKSLQEEIADLEKLIASDIRIKNTIAAQLNEVKKKYGKPRLTQLIGAEDIAVYDEDDMVEDYNVKLIFTGEGYFKKITLLSLRGNDEQKLKDGDYVTDAIDASNTDELIFFSDKGQVYKAKVADFDTVKASQLGDYIPGKLGFEDGERAIAMKKLDKNDVYGGSAVIIFANGKGIRIPLSAYETKGNRRRLTGAYSTASAPAGIVLCGRDEDKDILIVADNGKCMTVNSSLVPEKATRTSQGVTIMQLKGGSSAVFATAMLSTFTPSGKSYKKIKVPCAPMPMSETDLGAMPDRVKALIK